MSAEIISIVDENDAVSGGEERQLARQKGLIHRVVRILIKNSEGKIIIQQRSAQRADHPLKWEWSASGHVQAGEDYAPAAAREAREEIGVTTPLSYLGKYYYEEKMSDELILKRYNGVFIGHSDQNIKLDPEEVADARWVTPDELARWIDSHPNDFTTNALEGFRRFLTKP